MLGEVSALTPLRPRYTRPEWNGNVMRDSTRLRQCNYIQTRCSLAPAAAKDFTAAVLYAPYIRSRNSSLKATISERRFEKRLVSRSSCGKPRRVSFKP